ncbi:hypothetical protein KCP78_14995 [Salmonella enterica subsp. enterica]|nr:hypothetical protein KCP78_14995 [Salmonella enterica subsp. enterica]
MLTRRLIRPGRRDCSGGGAPRAASVYFARTRASWRPSTSGDRDRVFRFDFTRRLGWSR